MNAEMNRLESLTPEQAYGAFLAMNASFFAIGAAGTFWADKLKDPRLAAAARPSLARFADVLVASVRFLCFLVLLLSLYLFYRLWQIYPCVVKP